MRFLFILLALMIAGAAQAQDEFIQQDQPFEYDYTNDGAPPAPRPVQPTIGADGIVQQPATTDDIITQQIPQPGAELPPVAPIASPPPASAVPAPTYEQQKFAVLQTLDKLTARTATMTVLVGQATAVGPLFVDIKTCQKTPPTEQPESAAFIQVWEATPRPKLKRAGKTETREASQWVFSGWMFASSPSLSAMDHPVYDVWLKDCVSEIAAPKKK